MTKPTPERWAERSEQNPTGPLFRDFNATITGREGETALSIAISSEAPVLRYDWRAGELYYEVLDHAPESVDLSYVKDGIPFCLDHSLWSQIGIGETVRVDDDKILRTELTPGSHPDASWVFADMRNGIRKKVSVGYDPGDSYFVEEVKTNEYATRRYTRWMPFEVSSVSVPADYAVGVGRAAGSGATRGSTLPITEAARSAQPEARSMEPEVSGAAAAPEAPTGPTREQQLALLAKQHGRSSDLIEWIATGRSVSEVKDTLLTEASERNAARPSVVADAVHNRAEDKPWEGAEFFRSVIDAEKSPHTVDVRLLSSRSQNTSTGADGGFAVPPAVVTQLFSTTKTAGELMSRVTQRPITVGNSLKETLIKEESRVSGSRNGGLRHYWVSQEGDITQSQAKLRELELNVKKVAAAVPVTEEQIADGPALLSFLQEQVPDEMLFGKELTIWSGSGAGQPLGFMSSGALITVAIEGTQTIANTAEFIWKNGANMMTRMNPSAFLRAAYFINPALWAKLVTATAGTAANGAAPMFTPPGRLVDAPFGALYGRPIVPVEYASAEGTLGDFVLGDLSDYLFATKGGINFSQSMHVEFLKDKQVLKFTERVDGQPRTRVPLTPLNGSVTTSPYVALAARS